MDILANNTTDSAQIPTSQGTGGTQNGGGQSQNGNGERMDCPYCENGIITLTHWNPCDRCGHDGRIDTDGDGVDDAECTRCGGRGVVPLTVNVVCPECHGDGYLDPGDPGYGG